MINGTKRLSTVFIDLKNRYITNISNMYNPNVNMSLASQTKHENMFTDTKSDNIFLHFSVNFLVHILFLLLL